MPELTGLFIKKKKQRLELAKCCSERTSLLNANAQVSSCLVDFICIKFNYSCTSDMKHKNVKFKKNFCTSAKMFPIEI